MNEVLKCCTSTIPLTKTSGKVRIKFHNSSYIFNDVIENIPNFFLYLLINYSSLFLRISKLKPKFEGNCKKIPTFHLHRL